MKKLQWQSNLFLGRQMLPTIINPSGVSEILQPRSYTLLPSTPEIPSKENSNDENSNENSGGELLHIAGKSLFDHDKIHEK